MHVEILFRFVVHVDLELGNIVLSLGGNNQVVGRPDLELFPFKLFIFLFLERRKETEKDQYVTSQVFLSSGSLELTASKVTYGSSSAFP